MEEREKYILRSLTLYTVFVIIFERLNEKWSIKQHGENNEFIEL
jgi:hypothetical protein